MKCLYSGADAGDVDCERVTNFGGAHSPRQRAKSKSYTFFARVTLFR